MDWHKAFHLFTECYHSIGQYTGWTLHPKQPGPYHPRPFRVELHIQYERCCKCGKEQLKDRAETREVELCGSPTCYCATLGGSHAR